MMRRHFRRRRGGGVDVTLEAAEAEMLARLSDELSGLLTTEATGDPAGDAVLRRLFPRAYLDPTEEESEEEWQRLAHSDLVDARREALDVLERSIAQGRSHRRRVEISLSEEEAEAWLSVLNDARLALGTRLDVTEDLDPSSFDHDDPAAAPLALYWWLGYLEESLVETLTR